MIKIRFIGKIFVTCLCAGVSVIGVAQNKRLTLPDALKQAEANYPSIKAAQFNKNSAEYNLSVRKSEYLPALKLQEQITYATANGAIGTFYPNEGMALPTSGAIRPENIYTAVFGTYSTIAVDWGFFNFGKIKARVDYAKAQLNETDMQYENELFQHKIRVTDAYLLLIAFEKEEVVQEKNLQRAGEIKKAVAAAAKSGLKSGADSSFANAELSKAKIVLIEAQGRVASEKIKLNELLGTSGSAIEIDTANYVSSIPAFKTKDSVDVANNPQLKLYQSKMESEFARSNTVMKSYLPSLRFVAAGMGRGSGISNTNDKYNQGFSDGTSYSVYNYLIGVYFLWNVMDYPRIHSEYKSELMHAQESKSIYDEEKLKVQSEVANAELQLSIARSQATEAPIGLKSASDAYAQSNARYQSGLATLTDLTQNIYLLNRAESDLVIANNNVWRALLLKAAAAGDLTIFLNAK